MERIPTGLQGCQQLGTGARPQTFFQSRRGLDQLFPATEW